MAPYSDPCFLPHSLASITPLSTMISSSDMNHNFDAVDTQICMAVSVSNAKEFLSKLQVCLYG